MRSKRRNRVIALVLCMVLALGGSVPSLFIDSFNADEISSEESAPAVQSEESATKEDTTTDTPVAEEKQETSEPATEKVSEETKDTTTTKAETKDTEDTETSKDEKKDTTKTEEKAPHQDATTLKHVFNDTDGNLYSKITAKIPAETFEANTEDVTMEVSIVEKQSTLDTIEKLMKKNVADDKQLGNYFLYKVVFKVNGKTVEPKKAIEITFEQTNFQIDDVKKASAFYFNEADSVEGNAKAEIKTITQRDDKIKELKEAGKSTDTMDDDYDLSEITLNKDGSAKKVIMEGRRSTIYGCYLTEGKASTVVTTNDTTTTNDKTEGKAETKDETTDTTKDESKDVTTTEDKTDATQLESKTYSDKDVNVTVTETQVGNIPKDTTLKVIPILKDDAGTKNQYNNVKTQLDEKAVVENYDIAGFLAYDISFVDVDGNKVEPNGEVDVTIEYIKDTIPEDVSAANTNLDVTVMHLEEDTNGQVENVVDMVADPTKEATVETTDKTEVKKAEFKTDSFSVYAFTWTSGGNTYKVNLNYVDENGNPIAGKSGTASFSNAATIDLTNSNYRIAIDNYTYKYTTINSYNNSARISTLYRNGNTVYYYANSWTTWNSNKVNNVYLVYESKGIYDFNNNKLTLTSYENYLNAMKKLVETDPQVPITNWMRSSKQLNLNRNKSKDSWKWSSINALTLDITDQSEVWDGSRLSSSNVTDHKYADYIDQYESGKWHDTLSIYNGEMYDSATWSMTTSTKNASSMYRFRGEFKIPANMDPNDYSFTLKPVTPSNDIYINDDIYVFVYPKNVTLTDSNYMDYLAFWTGTANQSGTISFNGRTGTACTQNFVNNTNKYSDYSKVTDGWCMAAVQDNAANAILNAYNDNGDTEYYVDVITDDYASGGGMYRLQMATQALTRHPIEFTKVNSLDNVTAVAGAKFELDQISSDGKTTGVHYSATSGTDGKVSLNVVAGTYTMTETAPTGYYQPNGNWTVTVYNNGSYIIGWNGDTTGDNSSAVSGSQGSYKITNVSNVKGSYTFKKVNSKGAGLAGAEFTLTKSDGSTTVLTSTSDGSVTASNLPVGIYTITETKAPTVGSTTYLPSTDTWVIEVAVDGKTTMYKQGDDTKTKVTQVVNLTEKEQTLSTLTNTKTAKVVDKANRIYQLDLSATVTGREEGTEASAASVVLVLDASGSMKENGKSLDDVKKAAKDLISGLIKTSPKSEVSVIWYSGGDGSNASKDSYATDSGFKSGTDIQYLTATQTGFIDKKLADGGTPMDAALKAANKRLDSAVNDNKYVLFFTDGQPGYNSGSENWNCMIANGAKNYASQIKTKAVLYTVGYGLTDSDKFNWHDGDSDATTATSGGRPTTTYHTSHASMTGKQFLSDYIASSGTDSNGESYAKEASGAAALANIFKSIAAQIGALSSLQPESIVDVIDSRFELTAESEVSLKSKYGNDLSIVKNADGTTTLTWTGESAKIKNANDGGWTASLKVQAKEDFIGGNMVATNGPSSGINVDDETFRGFPQPSVNVKLLTPTIGDKEITVYKGDTIESSKFSEELYNTFNVKELDGTTSLNPDKLTTTTGITGLTQQELTDLADGKTVSKDYAYPGTTDVVGHFEYVFAPVTENGSQQGTLDDHEATTVGNHVEHYQLVITFVPDTVTERVGDLATITRPTSEGGTEVTSITTSPTTGNYWVNVLNRWNIIKRSTSNHDVYLGGAEFTLTKSGVTYYGVSAENTGLITWYKEATHATVIELYKMSAGDYTLEETKAPENYAKSSEKWLVKINENGLMTSITQLSGTAISATNKTDSNYYFDNTILYDLPSTGGIGIFWYMIGGMLLMMAAALILYKNKGYGEVLKR